MSGHSHWSTIKRAKGANDAKRGKVWSKIARKIIIAAKKGGDPRDNLTLRYVIDEAKAVNMPKDTIQNAILKGTGELGAENFDDLLYEGYAPGGVALIVEVLTNNRARTAPEMRKIFEVHGGNMANSGAVAFQFSKQGVITYKAEGVDEDALLEEALEAGAEDVKNEVEVFEVFTAAGEFHRVKDALAEKGYTSEAAEVAYLPNTTILIDAQAAEKLMKLVEAIEDNDDVQTVAHNAELPDSVE